MPRSIYPAPHEESKDDLLNYWRLIIPVSIFILLMAWCFSSCNADPARASEYSDEQIVNAIYHAEGGAKAQYAYGIRFIPYRTITDARRYCFNTVRNNRKRFANQSKYTDYLEFLASRYCPVSAHPLNKNWLKNVRYFLAKKGA